MHLSMTISIILVLTHLNIKLKCALFSLYLYITYHILNTGLNVYNGYSIENRCWTIDKRKFNVTINVIQTRCRCMSKRYHSHLQNICIWAKWQSVLVVIQAKYYHHLLNGTVVHLTVCTEEKCAINQKTWCIWQI